MTDYQGWEAGSRCADIPVGGEFRVQTETWALKQIWVPESSVVYILSILTADEKKT